MASNGFDRDHGGRTPDGPSLQPDCISGLLGHCPHVGAVMTRRGGGAVVTGAEGTVVGGAKVEPAPLLAGDGTPLEGAVVEGVVVEGDTLGGDDTADGGADTAATGDLAWLGVSWNASVYQGPSGCRGTERDQTGHGLDPLQRPVATTGVVTMKVSGVLLGARAPPPVRRAVQRSPGFHLGIVGVGPCQIHEES